MRRIGHYYKINLEEDADMVEQRVSYLQETGDSVVFDREPTRWVGFRARFSLWLLQLAQWVAPGKLYTGQPPEPKTYPTTTVVSYTNFQGGAAMLNRLFKLFRRRKRKRRPEPEILEEVPPEIPDPKPVKYMSPEGIDFLKKWEGVRHEAYEDAIGLLTIGVGHLLTRDELSSGKLFLAGRWVLWREPLSEKDVEGLLRMDLVGAEDAVHDVSFDVISGKKTEVQLSQPQFDALVSFTFNVGQRAFSDSTLLRKLREGDFEGAAAEFPRWRYAGGKVLRGLERRRAAEREMFLA